MSGLVVLGALHHDVVVDAPRLPRLDETLVGSAVDYRFGGKGGNQALAAARMGGSVRMVGRVGDDAAGQSLLAVLDGAGIDRSGAQVGAQPTGMSVAITDASGDYGAVIVSGANIENDGQVAMDPAPEIALIQNEIPEAANRALAAALPDNTLLVWNAAPAREWDTAIGNRTDLLIVNRVEAADLTGCHDPETAAEALLIRVRGAIIVTLGADGVVLALPFIDPKICRGARGAAPLAKLFGEKFSSASHISRLPARAVEAVSSHGAGDMFAGALAARLLAGDSLVDAIQFAQTAAALFVAAPIAERSAITDDLVKSQMS